MKEESLNKLTEKALTYLESAEAFVGEQVPKYIEELLGYKFFENVVDLSIALGILGVLILLGGITYLGIAADKDSKGIRKFLYEKTPDKGDLVAAFAGIGAGLMLLINVFSVADLLVPSVKNLYKIKNAPRVYLVEYFRKEMR